MYKKSKSGILRLALCVIEFLTRRLDESCHSTLEGVFRRKRSSASYTPELRNAIYHDERSRAHTDHVLFGASTEVKPCVNRVLHPRMRFCLRIQAHFYFLLSQKILVVCAHLLT